MAQKSQEEATVGTVFDTRGWTSLFSAMPTYQAERAKDAFADPQLEYVVVMEEELLSSSERSRTLRTLLDRGAKRVARFNSPDTRCPTDALMVYRCLKNFSSPNLASSSTKPVLSRSLKSGSEPAHDRREL